MDQYRKLKKRLSGKINDRTTSILKPIPFNNRCFNVDIDERPEFVGYRIKDVLSKDHSLVNYCW